MGFYKNGIDDPRLGLGNYGLDYLSLSEAATLIAKILFLEGDLKDEVQYEREDGSYSLHDPELEKVLQKQIQEFQEILITGVIRGTLTAAHISRYLNEKIIPEETYVSEGVLHDWLKERNYSLEGDWYQQRQWEQVEIFEAIIEAIEVTHAKLENPTLHKEFKLKHESDDRFLALAESRTQIAELESEIAKLKATKPEKPLSTREKDTLLKLVVGMAAAYYGYDPRKQKNTATREIADELQRVGISISEDTVLKWLREGADFLPQEEKA